MVQCTPSHDRNTIVVTDGLFVAQDVSKRQTRHRTHDRRGQSVRLSLHTSPAPAVMTHGLVPPDRPSRSGRSRSAPRSSAPARTGTSDRAPAPPRRTRAAWRPRPCAPEQGWLPARLRQAAHGSACRWPHSSARDGGSRKVPRSSFSDERGGPVEPPPANLDIRASGSSWTD